jgi:hypothetical protein
MNYHTGRLLITTLQKKIEAKISEIEKLTDEVDELNDELTKIEAKMFVDMSFGESLRRLRQLHEKA